MKRIFINLNSPDGCTLHRLIIPYSEVIKQTDEFQFTWGYSKSDLTLQEKIDEIGKHDILLFHRLLPDGLLEGLKKQYPNVKVVMDVDDYWRLNDMHPAYWLYKSMNIPEKILYHLKNVDCVTCTTEYLAKKIKDFNKNVTVFPNALKAEGQFKPNPIPSTKLRFGLIGGSSHVKDIELLEGVVNQLPKDILNQVQFVLCGFDKGIYHTPDGKTAQMPWEENKWTDVERLLTNNYNTISSEHKDFLKKYEWKLEFNSDEPYKRVWTKDIKEYATSYNEIDVLLVPLIGNDFTACKSELKLVEASVMNKAVIVSDVAPYTNCGINAIEKGGTINPNGNCIMINNNKGSKAWVKAIVKLVKDKELLDMIKNNLSKLTESGKYCLTDLTKERIKYLEAL